MQVNAAQNASLFQTNFTVTGSEPGFRAALENARENITPTAVVTTSKSAPAAAKTPQQELEEILKKNPIQRMREAILKEMGLTEADLDAMPPEKRDAIEAAIEARIKEYLLGDKASAQLMPIRSDSMQLVNGVVEVQTGEARLAGVIG